MGACLTGSILLTKIKKNEKDGKKHLGVPALVLLLSGPGTTHHT